MDYVTTKDMTVTKATIAEDINREIGLSKEYSAAIIDDILEVTVPMCTGHTSKGLSSYPEVEEDELG